MALEITPLRGKLIAEALPEHKQTASGLYIAENVKEVPRRGRVIGLGRPWRDDRGKEYPWGIEIGEIVHFKRQWAQNKDTHFILKRDEIFCVERPIEVAGYQTYYPAAVMDMVIVQRFYTKKIGNSSLVIPETFGIQSNLEDFYGFVISVGQEDKLGIKNGDKLIYSRNEGSLVKMKDKDEYFALKPRAILGRII